MTENKNSGHLNIFPLLAFVAQRATLPPLLNKSDKSKSTPYRKAVINMLQVAGVPQKTGWYVWGKFNDAGFWESIYVGKTSAGTGANLRIRLRDELQEESAAIFATVYGRYWTATAARRVFRDHAKRGGRDWSAGIDRSLRKTGAHFIVWTVAPEGMVNKEVERVESALISVFRPGFNIKRPKVDREGLYSDPKIYPSVVALEEEIGRIVGEN